MKNTILKTTVCFAAIVIGTSAFAGDHHGGPDRHHECNSGVRLATDIVNLVGASLNILSPAPVVYSTPAYSTPAYCPPPPKPYHHRRPAPPKPRHSGHGPCPRR